jgi:hypothetical protein
MIEELASGLGVIRNSPLRAVFARDVLRFEIYVGNRARGANDRAVL